VLGILIDSVNEYVAKSGFYESIDIDINDEASVISNMEKLINFLNQYKHRIFGKDSKLFKKLLDTVSQTHSFGEKNEDFAIEKLKKIFGNDNVTKVGELGSKKDMGDGVDAEINYSGKLFTAQIKPIDQIIEIDGNFEITITSGVKKYKTDWMIFVKGKSDIYIFDNSKINIVGDKYVTPKSSQLFNID